jgi:hypothetical protein
MPSNGWNSSILGSDALGVERIRPAVLVLGVEDGTKKIRGVPNILAEEERVANLIADLSTTGAHDRSDVLAKDAGFGGRELSERQPAPFSESAGSRGRRFCPCGFDQPTGGSRLDRRDVAL